MAPIGFINFDLVAHAGCQSSANVQACGKHGAGVAFAKNHISRFTIRCIAIFGSHHQIGQAVTVGVACTVDCDTKVIARKSRDDFKARTGGNGAATQVRHGTIGVAIHDKSSATCRRQAIHASANDKVVVTVAIEVTDGGQVFNGCDAVRGHHNGTAGVSRGEVQRGRIRNTRIGVSHQIFHRCGRDLDVVTGGSQQISGRVDGERVAVPTGDQAAAGCVKTFHQSAIDFEQLDQACAFIHRFAEGQGKVLAHVGNGHVAVIARVAANQGGGEGVRCCEHDIERVVSTQAAVAGSHFDEHSAGGTRGWRA